MNVQDVLKYGDLTLLKAVDGLKNKDQEKKGACGVWSIKDILSHLTSYEIMLSDLLGTFLNIKEQTPTLDLLQNNGGEFNDIEVGKRANKPFSEILKEYKKAHSQVMKRAKQIPVKMLSKNGAIPWYGDFYSLEDYIVYRNYGHKREHCAQIVTFRDNLNS